ncbi:MAG: CheR family methyltransferase [Daejeonella sp.]|uniref:CheR family methyltransferase n=1 Tax=Daejeonella sp. TaxID=2805397 RepID=UPI003C77F20E
MLKKKGSDSGSVSDLQFPIVGIGASAGGLEAVSLFLQAIPEKSGMAYVFVQHLNPEHESALPEILQKSAKIPVHQITDDIHLEQDNFYIIPANKIVTATDGVLKLAPLNDKHHKVKVIDIFFSSLAVVHQSYAVGIVLSGMLNDGTLGLQVIKTHGGITFAQDEASAAFDDMPKNAVRIGAVDFVFPPAKIAEHLLTINHPFHADYSKKEIANTVPEQDEQIFKQLLTVLRVRRGVDFTYYKPSTLKRRIIRRMALNNINKPDAYLKFLRENMDEQDALYNDMLISVTNFFRDQASFELLCNTIFPALVEQKDANEPLRIWIAGCATGEEAYSMAICLQEQLGDKAAAMKIQIFATDISETAINKARTGIYRPSDLEGLSASRLAQFFTKLDGSYQVNKIIRDICVFAHHNLLKDSPFSKIDLISCRNVMIYLEPVLQKRALTTFHYALNEQGFLMLGKSENIGGQTDMFAPYNSQEKIFKRKGGRGRFMPVTSQGGEQNFKDIDKSGQKESGTHDVFKLTDNIVIATAPAGVLVGEQFDIVQFRGATETWLVPPPGKASLNVLKMAREGLAFELRNLLHLAKRSSAPAKKENVLFNLNGEQHYVNITVWPIIDADDPHYLVQFEKEAAILPSLPSGKKKNSAKDPKDIRIAELEQELMQNRADMRTITEEQEAVNEELQSSNQELLSSSEELQSLNEELETSKEELQSTNEEITIVNNELINRNDQLNNARLYTEGIINTIRDPLIILDADLKVKRATDGFYHKFKVTEKETEGQYFYELGNRQWDIPVLRELLENIVPQKKVLVDYEVSHVFPGIGRKIMYLNTRLLDNVHGDQLILMAIEDITDRRKIEEGLTEVEQLFEESRERLKMAVDAADIGIWDYQPLTGDLVCDNGCKKMFGLVHTAEIDYPDFITMIHPDDRSNIEEYLKQIVSGKNKEEYEKEFRILETGKQKQKWIRFKGKAYFNSSDAVNRVIGVLMDVTVQKQAEEQTRQLLKQKDDFISIASHELKTPITTLTISLQILDKMKDNPSKVLPSLVERANKSLNKVNILISDLLSVTQFNKGEVSLNKSLMMLSEIIEDCCAHIRAEGIYSIITKGDMNLRVRVDVQRIEQVIVNFVNNAIKYAPNSKEILITIEKIGDMAKVSVIDKGIGIPADKIPHLFDRYFRVDSSGSQYSGLGLGLYISGEIIKKHGGKIGVDSEVGKGSAFWFSIPIDSD